MKINTYFDEIFCFYSTNVMSSNNRGAGPGCNTQEAGKKLTDLKDELLKLDEHEKTLDLHTKWIKQSIKNIEGDLMNKKYAFITYEDLKENFPDECFLGIQAPTESKLVVPDVDKVEFKSCNE